MPFNSGTHCFVVWTVEQTVTVVKRKKVQSDEIVIGKEVDVIWVQNIKYPAKVAATGMYCSIHKHVHVHACCE